MLLAELRAEVARDARQPLRARCGERPELPHAERCRIRQ